MINKLKLLWVAVGLSLGSAMAQAGNITPYYLFDGDSALGYQITNGVVTNTFLTYTLGYPVAIRSTIWLGHRDDDGAVEYTLGGVPTGSTSVGGNKFGELLDGATGNGGKNYGIECCDAPNSVTVANTDWTNQQVLFNLGNDGAGIAFDPTNNTLYLSFLGNLMIEHRALDGTLLNSLSFGQPLVGLAYEEASDTFWGFNTATDNLVQFNRLGAVLQDVDIPGFSPRNPFGGEMPVTGNVAVVPVPGTLALLGLGLLGLSAMRQRRNATRA